MSSAAATSIRVAAHQRDARRMHGHIGAVAHGHATSAAARGRGIVHAVAYHRHNARLAEPAPLLHLQRCRAATTGSAQPCRRAAPRPSPRPRRGPIPGARHGLGRAPVVPEIITVRMPRALRAASASRAPGLRLVAKGQQCQHPAGPAAWVRPRPTAGKALLLQRQRTLRQRTAALAAPSPRLQAARARPAPASSAGCQCARSGPAPPLRCPALARHARHRPLQVPCRALRSRCHHGAPARGVRCRFAHRPQPPAQRLRLPRRQLQRHQPGLAHGQRARLVKRHGVHGAPPPAPARP